MLSLLESEDPCLDEPPDCQKTSPCYSSGLAEQCLASQVRKGRRFDVRASESCTAAISTNSGACQCPSGRVHTIGRVLTSSLSWDGQCCAPLRPLKDAGTDHCWPPIS